jgi:protein-L-isoaspartate(D-aspartate) O-methyltransferase
VITEKQDFARQRGQMIINQIKERGIHNPAILAALDAVPRAAFISEVYWPYAYEDIPLPLPAGQTISQPYVTALMINALKLKPTDRVLEIGTGSGYGAAVLSHIAAEVFTIERIATLVAYAQDNLERLGYHNIHIRHGDGTLGWPDRAPFDAILITAGGPIVPPSLRQQLAIGGRLVMPVGGHPHRQHLVRITRRADNSYTRHDLGRVAFVPLIGSEAWQEPV